MRRVPPLLAVVVLCAPAIDARHPVRARKAMVVAQEPIATDVGIRVLRSGGNAVDAAVAIGFVLAVTLPAAGNLGGGGFMLVRNANGETSFIDFRERAPEAASRDMYLDPAGKPTRDSVLGWRASGVPGTVRGLEYAHRKWGRKRWRQLVTPSADLARRGFEVSYGLSTSLASAASRLEQFPESRRVFLRNGRLYEPGERFRQPDLARTLERIAKGGANEFYTGRTARLLAHEMQRNGGLITAADLKAYTVSERAPLTGRYKSHDIITAPPPSAGGVGLLQMLAILEGSGYEKHGLGSAAQIHYVAEAMRRAYADRSEHLGDPDFSRVPISGLLAPPYIQRLRQSISAERAGNSSEVRPGVFDRESSETTHYAVVDEEGNAAAVTYTINGSYGSGVTVPGLGFLLNNEMDDFAVKPGTPNLFGLIQGDRNAIQPRKRPLSSMTPTMVLRDGKLFMIAGAPGGSRITTGVLQVLLNVIDFGLNVQDAVDRPRFHHQWLPDTLYVEAGFSPDTLDLLRRKGHKLTDIANVALVEAIHIDKGWLQGAADGRAYSKAAGY